MVETGVKAPGVEATGVAVPGVKAAGVVVPGVEAVGVDVPGVPPGVGTGVVPGVAGVITTEDGLGLSALARASRRGVEGMKRASLIR